MNQIDSSAFSEGIWFGAKGCQAPLRGRWDPPVDPFPGGLLTTIPNGVVSLPDHPSTSTGLNTGGALVRATDGSKPS